MFLLASALFNGFAVNVTKFASATNRVVMDQTRVVLIWAFFLVYQGTGHETFSWGKLGGFLMIVFGVVMFNKIINLDCCSKPQGDEIEITSSQKHLSSGEPVAMSPRKSLASETQASDSFNDSEPTTASGMDIEH